MNIVIGFGSTETKLEDELEAKIRSFVASEAVEKSPNYFTDDFKVEIEDWIKAQAANTRRASDEYKTAEDYPSRYSYFYANVLADACHLVFILNFSHINRRHGLSPDGWAMLQSERVFYINHYDAVAA